MVHTTLHLRTVPKGFQKCFHLAGHRRCYVCQGLGFHNHDSPTMHRLAALQLADHRHNGGRMSPRQRKLLALYIDLSKLNPDIYEPLPYGSLALGIGIDHADKGPAVDNYVDPDIP